MSGPKKKKKREPDQSLILSEKESIELTRLSEQYPEVKKLFSIYNGFTENPAKQWLATINYIAREIKDMIMSKQLDIMFDGYHKSLWEILKGGSTAAKTISSAMKEADMDEEDPEEEEVTLGEQEKPTGPVPVISAETAYKNV